MASRAVVREWSSEQGCGVLDCPDTPGGCWAHDGAVAVPGYRELERGQEVELERVSADQDGYAFRATRTWPVGAEPYESPAHSGPTEAMASTLTVVVDDHPTGTRHRLDRAGDQTARPG